MGFKIGGVYRRKKTPTSGPVFLAVTESTLLTRRHGSWCEVTTSKKAYVSDEMSTDILSLAWGVSAKDIDIQTSRWLMPAVGSVISESARSVSLEGVVERVSRMNLSPSGRT